MAQKKKAPSRASASKAESTKVTRITAKDTAPKQKKTSVNPASTKKSAPQTTNKPTKKAVEQKRSFLGAIGDYFKGSWTELRQVRWPNRRTTWSLTLAVLVFTAFFVLLVTLLDYLFQMLFERILG